MEPIHWMWGAALDLGAFGLIALLLANYRPNKHQ